MRVAVVNFQRSGHNAFSVSGSGGKPSTPLSTRRSGLIISTVHELAAVLNAEVGCSRPIAEGAGGDLV